MLGNNLGNVFQVVSPGCLTSTTTNIKYFGVDLNLLYAGRDNRTGNAVSSNTNYKTSGSDLINKFNKKDAVFEVSLTGTVTYDGSPKTVTFTYTPTNIGIVPTLSPSTVSNTGTYTGSSFSIVGSVPTSYIKQITGSFTITP